MPPCYSDQASSMLVHFVSCFVCSRCVRCVVGAFIGGTFGKVPDVGLLTSVRTKAAQMSGDWGKLTAAFTGFTSVSTVIRGRCVDPETRIPYGGPEM